MINQKKRKFFLLAIFAYSAGLVGTAGFDVDAAVRRVHAGYCNVDEEGIDSLNSYSLGVFFDINGASVHCPIPSDSTLLHGSVVTLNVHGKEASGKNNTSRACAVSYNSASISCGTWKGWGSGYSGAYGVDVSVWTANPYWFPSVQHQIAYGGTLKGHYLSDV